MHREPEQIGALRKSWILFCNDLRLLGALCLAHFIVWRELRRVHREGEVR
jgi:hypothetical protein